MRLNEPQREQWHLTGLVASATVAWSMGCCQRRVRVGRDQVVGCEWVIIALSFSTDPARYGCVSDLLGSLRIVPFVMLSSQVALLIPLCLASVASWRVSGQCATGQTRALDSHYFRCLSLMIFGTVLFHFMEWCSRLCDVPILRTVTEEGAMITVNIDFTYVPMSR